MSIPRSEREHTDRSLRLERETADAVILRARARADEVLATARAKADQRVLPSSTSSSGSLATERKLEDQTLREERALADETLRVERSEQVARLSLERVETDHDLSSERARSDVFLATRDEFLGVVSHSLRNMLNGIIGFAGLIDEGSRDHHDPAIALYAQRIQRSGARMNRLVGDLVDIASIEAGKLAVTPVLGDASQVVRDAVDTFQAQASAQGISLLAEIAEPLLPVEFDPGRILQVLVNLVSNAVKFTPAKGRVVARLECPGDEILFAVTDTGTGIPADQLVTIFERFPEVTKNDNRGVRLGLYISSCIVQGHGGRIWAESTVGAGSAFYFALPIRGAT